MKKSMISAATLHASAGIALLVTANPIAAPMGALRFGSAHRIALYAILSGDRLTFDEIDGDERLSVSTRWSNGGVWATWTAYPSRQVRVETTTALGGNRRRRTGSGAEPGRVLGPEEGQVVDQNRYSFFGVRHEWSVDLAEGAELAVGGEVWDRRARYDYENWSRTADVDDTGVVQRYDTISVKVVPSGTDGATYVQTRFRLASVVAETGLRWDRVEHTAESYLSPRLGATWSIGRTSSLRGSWGIYRQSHGVHELQVEDGDRAFGPSERASHVALGVEQSLGHGVRARLEAYWRSVSDPLTRWIGLARTLAPFPELEGDRLLLSPDAARARGVELSAEYRGPSWDGSFSYVIASSEERVDARWIPRELDQRHAFTAQIGYSPGSDWLLSAAWQYHTGWPFTPRTLEVDALAAGGANVSQAFGPVNQVRLPAYHRLDVRATRRFGDRVEIWLDLFNAYNRRNVRSFAYDIVAGPSGELELVRQPGESLLPLLPSIGLRWEL